MFLRILFCVLIVIGQQCATIAGENQTNDKKGFTFFPGDLLFQPLTASYQEPRVGLRKEVGTSRMKLDIGSSLDVLEYSFNSDGSQRLRMGVDFFTYALSTSSEGLRLQVDAVDGFFGGHLAWRSQLNDARVTVRLRLLHLSAHFLDGHYDFKSNSWKGGRLPIPFTKDFGELIGAYEIHSSSLVFMIYSGFSYSTLVRPEIIKRISTIHGFEIHSAEMLGPVFGRPFHVYLADNLGFVGIPKYIGTNNIEVGIKFGDWSGAGLKLYGSYYSGLEMFSQYFDQRTSQWGIGFAFDFW